MKLKFTALHLLAALLLSLGLLSAKSGHSYQAETSQPDSSTIKFKVRFIHEIAKIAHDELGFQTDSSFYKQWQENDNYYFYIYCSYPDSISNPLNAAYDYIGTDEKKSQERKLYYDSLGYQTLVYKTAGTSAGRLNKQLISYPYETIAFIVLHEAFHQHALSTGRQLPYEMEEAACDVLGNYLTQMLEKRFTQYSKKQSKNLVKLHEDLYAAINKYDSLITMMKGNVPQGLYTFCYDDIQALLKKGSNFQRDRFSYPVNNAFFVRYRFYAANYFLLKNLYLKLNDPKKFMEVMTNLSKDVEESKKMIRKKIKG